MRYKLYQNKNVKSLAYGKWYARGLHEVMTFSEFVKHMAEHHWKSVCVSSCWKARPSISTNWASSSSDSSRVVWPLRPSSMCVPMCLPCA